MVVKGSQVLLMSGVSKAVLVGSVVTTGFQIFWGSGLVLCPDGRRSDSREMELKCKSEK